MADPTTDLPDDLDALVGAAVEANDRTRAEFVERAVRDRFENDPDLLIGAVARLYETDEVTVEEAADLADLDPTAMRALLRDRGVEPADGVSEGEPDGESEEMADGESEEMADGESEEMADGEAEEMADATAADPATDERDGQSGDDATAPPATEPSEASDSIVGSVAEASTGNAGTPEGPESAPDSDTPANGFPEGGAVLGPSAVRRFREDPADWTHSLPPTVLTPELVKTCSDDYAKTLLGVEYNGTFADPIDEEGELSGVEQLENEKIPVAEYVDVEALSDDLVRGDRTPRERFAEHLDADDRVELNSASGLFGGEGTTADADDAPQFDGLSAAQTSALIVADALDRPVVTDSKRVQDEAAARGVAAVSTLGAALAAALAARDDEDDEVPAMSVRAVLDRDDRDDRDDALTAADVAAQVDADADLSYDFEGLKTAVDRAAIAFHTDRDPGEVSTVNAGGIDDAEREAIVETRQRIAREVSRIDAVGVEAWGGEEATHYSSITHDKGGQAQ